MNKAQNKRIELGEKLYDEFVEKLADTFGMSSHVSNPRTYDLELYAVLKNHCMEDILFEVMVNEYLTNFVSSKLSVEKGRLYHHFEIKQAL